MEDEELRSLFAQINERLDKQDEQIKTLVIVPPADEPPADEPPADEPPADEPPADEPPADEPPADEPSADEPPADEPPADGDEFDKSNVQQKTNKSERKWRGLW